MHFSEKDYTYLEGKEIDWVRDDGKIFRGVVIGCDYPIGITIVDKENTDHYLECLRSKRTVRIMTRKSPLVNAQFYSAQFLNLICEIKRGRRITGWGSADQRLTQVIVDRLLSQGFIPRKRTPSSDVCAFNL